MKIDSASRAKEIQRLHREIWDDVRAALGKATQVEELLREQRASMRQDEWRSWVAENVPFAEQTVQDNLRQVLFTFTQDMGRTLIDIEAMNYDLDVKTGC
jgi:hypothetical protein